MHCRITSLGFSPTSRFEYDVTARDPFMDCSHSVVASSFVTSSLCLWINQTMNVSIIKYHEKTLTELVANTVKPASATCRI